MSNLLKRVSGNFVHLNKLYLDKNQNVSLCVFELDLPPSCHLLRSSLIKLREMSKDSPCRQDGQCGRRLLHRLRPAPSFGYPDDLCQRNALSLLWENAYVWVTSVYGEALHWSLCVCAYEMRILSRECDTHKALLTSSVHCWREVSKMKSWCQLDNRSLEIFKVL